MTGPDPTPAIRRPWPRWKSALLIVSLALNLVVIGMVATATIRHGFRPPFSASQATVVKFARTLPAERRREIWQATREQRQSLRPLWADLRRARSDVRAALTAQPFDPARYTSAHNRLLDAEIAVRRGANGLFETVATRLTAAERRQFALWQEEAEHHSRRRRELRRSAQEEEGEDESDAPIQSKPAPSGAAPAPSAKP